jgi:hypothetical protein
LRETNRDKKDEEDKEQQVLKTIHDCPEKSFSIFHIVYLAVQAGQIHNMLYTIFNQPL